MSQYCVSVLCISVVELLHEMYVIGFVSYAIYSVLINATNTTNIAWLDATRMRFRIKRNVSLHVGSTYLIA
jgi:hypothetical protein